MMVTAPPLQHTRYLSVAANGARKRVTLGKLIGRGGAGVVHELRGDAARVAKLYSDEKAAKEHLPKLQAMLLSPPDLPAIEAKGGRYVQVAWPEALLQDPRGRPVGFCMPRVPLDRAELLENLLQHPNRAYKKLPEDYYLRVVAATNLATMIDEFHKRGHHMIDMKPPNLIVYRETMYIAVIDCDGLEHPGARSQTLSSSPVYQ